MSIVDPVKTLPDYIRPGLHILSVGINPGRVSAERGFVFAHPRNRFWPAFNAAQIVPEMLEPSIESVEKLYTRYHIGFTDVVSRPTPQANDLTAADWRAGAPLLLEKLQRAQPCIAWFHGKMAFGNFLRHTGSTYIPPGWGLQDFEIGATRIFLTPSPSPANASFSLENLIGLYRELKRLRDRLCKGTEE